MPHFHFSDGTDSERTVTLGVGATPTVATVRMQYFDQNKEDFVYPVYLFRFATKAQSGAV